MKVLEFTYTKANGDTSKRTVLEVAKPSKFIAGFDISEVDPEVMLELAAEYNALETQFAEARLALQVKYDIKHNFRQFDPDRMTNTTHEFF